MQETAAGMSARVPRQVESRFVWDEIQRIARSLRRLRRAVSAIPFVLAVVWLGWWIAGRQIDWASRDGWQWHPPRDPAWAVIICENGLGISVLCMWIAALVVGRWLEAERRSPEELRAVLDALPDSDGEYMLRVLVHDKSREVRGTARRLWRGESW